MKTRNRILITLAACGLAACVQAGESTTMADFTGSNGRVYKDWSYDFQDNGSKELMGRVFVPPGYNPFGTEKYPLVVFYHGSYEAGTNNTSQMTRWPVLLVEAAQQNGFFVYLPQTPGDWYMPGDAPLDRSVLQIANLLRAYRIDDTKISATGFSMGGNAAYSLAGMHGEMLAALFPAEPNEGGLADVNAARLGGMPLWSLCNKADGVPYLVGINQRRVNQLRTKNGKTAWDFSGATTYLEDGNMRHSQPPNSLPYTASPPNHTPEWAYVKPELYTWLLAQTNTTAQFISGTIKVDFGAQQIPQTTGTDSVNNFTVKTDRRPDSSGVIWNSTSADFSKNFNAFIPFAKDITGKSTSVCLHVLNKLTGGDYSWSGTETTLYDDNIGKDGWMTAPGEIGKILVRGLTPEEDYHIEVFASNTLSDIQYQYTRYQIGTQVQDLKVYNNTSTSGTKAVFPSVPADSNGELVLEVSGVPGVSTVGMIGALEISLAASQPPVDYGSQLQGSGTPVCTVLDPPPDGGGNHSISVIRDGMMPAVGDTHSTWQYDTYIKPTRTREDEQYCGYDFGGTNQEFTKVVFQEGKHFVDGGWFNNGTLRIQVKRGSDWVDVTPTSVTPPYPSGTAQADFGQSFETYTFVLNNEVGCGVRIMGTAGGSAKFISVGELQAWGRPAPAVGPLQDSGSAICTVLDPPPDGGGNHNISVIHDGMKPAVGDTHSTWQYDTYIKPNRTREDEQYCGYTYSSTKTFTRVDFQEGKHFVDGGWFNNGTLRVQVQRGGSWVDVTPLSVAPAYPNASTQAAFGPSFESYSFNLNNETGTGIRIIGMAGGSAKFISIGELEVFGY